MLRLRSQHAIALIGGNRKLSLEDVIRLKHSYRMLLADRVKADLHRGRQATKPTGDVAAALALLRRVEQHGGAGEPRRGAVRDLVSALRAGTAGRRPSSRSGGAWPIRCGRRAASPIPPAPPRPSRGRWRRPRAATAAGTSRGATSTACAAAPSTCRSADVRGQMGCFRVLGFARDPDGKLSANSGDGWVLAVEFGDIPRAYSVLAYGESPQPASPWHADQAEMFARGELKQVAFTARDVDAQAVASYRPGER